MSAWPLSIRAYANLPHGGAQASAGAPAEALAPAAGHVPERVRLALA